MERYYWLCRKSEEIEMTRCATSPEARLAHQELARRYSLKAVDALIPTVVGLVIAQLPAAYVANDPAFTTIGDPVRVAPRGAAL